MRHFLLHAPISGHTYFNICFNSLDTLLFILTLVKSSWAGPGLPEVGQLRLQSFTLDDASQYPLLLCVLFPYTLTQ